MGPPFKEHLVGVEEVNLDAFLFPLGELRPVVRLQSASTTVDVLRLQGSECGPQGVACGEVRLQFISMAFFELAQLAATLENSWPKYKLRPAHLAATKCHTNPP